MAVTSDAEAEYLVSTLVRDGYPIRSLIEQTATGRLATVRLESGPDEDSPLADLLFASSGIEPEIVAAADLVAVFPGFRVPVACIGHLIALKVLAYDEDTRLQDLVDLHSLLVAADEEDLRTARAALSLISERGFNRDKDLQADLDAVLTRFRPAL